MATRKRALPPGTDDRNSEALDRNEVPFWTSCRLGLAVLGFLGFTLSFAMRVNLFVAVVCMVNHTAISDSRNHHSLPSSHTNYLNLTRPHNTVPSLTNLSHTLPVLYEKEGGGGEGEGGGGGEETEEGLGRGGGGAGAGGGCGWAGGSSLPENGTAIDSLRGTLLWDKTTQGLVLGSFFWGYLLSQIPAGLLVVRVGGKWCYGAAMLAASLLTLLTPLVATHLSFHGMVVLRILLGIASGAIFPAMHCMFGSWAPPLERTKLMTFSCAGIQVGIVITYPLGGFLCKYGFAGGWPSIFYILGGLSLVWLGLWSFFTSNTPADHRRISDLEKRYILSSLHTGTQTDGKTKKVPWRSILTSMPNYAIIVSNIASDWGLNTFLINMPTYIREVLGFDITSNGLLSALPFLGLWLTMNMSGWLADCLRARFLSTGATRKLMDAVGKLTAGGLLVAVGHIGCGQPLLVISVVVLAVSAAGLQLGGYLVNPVDIAPQYAGLLIALANSLAAVSGYLSPVITGVITEERQTQAEWRLVFYLAAAIYLFATIFYVIFASGDLQPWAAADEVIRKPERTLVVDANGERLMDSET